MFDPCCDHPKTVPYSIEHHPKPLNLPEDLTEAIALGHDFGHTPFPFTVIFASAIFYIVSVCAGRIFCG